MKFIFCDVYINLLVNVYSVQELYIPEHTFANTNIKSKCQNSHSYPLSFQFITVLTV